MSASEPTTGGASRDTWALDLATQILAVVTSEAEGGDVQRKARVQCLLLDAATQLMAARDFPADDGTDRFGKDCPAGKVQIEFVGVNPSLRYSAYGWAPSDSAFLEVYVDSDRYRIDVGSYASARGGTRRGLHVNGPFDLLVDKHSANAFDVFRAASGT